MSASVMIRLNCRFFPLHIWRYA